MEKRILIAEDDEADLVLMQPVLDKCGVSGQIMVTEDGEETLDYLYRRGKHRDAPDRPLELLLLDLKLPKVSGLEILRQIRGDDRLKNTPVVIFTSSLDERDKAAALADGADEFVIKPIDLDAYMAELERILCAYAVNCCTGATGDAR
jgi:two-component system response regulator